MNMRMKEKKCKRSLKPKCFHLQNYKKYSERNDHINPWELFLAIKTTIQTMSLDKILIWFLNKSKMWIKIGNNKIKIYIRKNNLIIKPKEFRKEK